jgi:hypothetical protein
MLPRNSGGYTRNHSRTEPELDYQPIASQTPLASKSQLKTSTIYSLLQTRDSQPPTLQAFLQSKKIKCQLTDTAFLSFTPYECARNECHIRMSFFLRDGDLFQPVTVDYELTMTQSLSAQNQLFYLNEARAKLPTTSSNLQIVYFYYMDFTNADSSSECLEEYNLIKNEEIRIVNQNKLEHLDGIIIFNPITQELSLAKRTCLETFMRLEYLFSPGIADVAVHVSCLDRLRSVYACLCSHDAEYRQLFVSIIRPCMQGFVAELGQQSILQLWQHLTLLNIVYICYEFEIVDIEFLSLVLGLNRPLGVARLKEIQGYFTGDKLKG